jgi:hypothetical protein
MSERFKNITLKKKKLSFKRRASIVSSNESDVESIASNIETNPEKRRVGVAPPRVSARGLKKPILDNELWNLLEKCQKDDCIKKIKYILSEFGTTNACNRFDVGNCIEFFIGDMLKNAGAVVRELPNAVRIDLQINNHYGVSIKYSGTRSGTVVLHNSNGHANDDVSMVDLLLLTKNELWLITEEQVLNYGYDVRMYLDSKPDCLKLRKSLLTALRKVDYPWKMSFDLTVEQCHNKLTSKILYDHVIRKFD